MIGKILALFFAVSFCVGCTPLLDDAPHLSDEKLMEVFRENEAEFELLAQMAEQDSNMVRIADNFTWTKDNMAFPRPESELGISKERWEDYKRLFGKLKLKAGIVNYQPDKIYLTSSTQGLATGGSSKGYAYLKEKPEILADSLDNFKFVDSNKDFYFAYKKLEGNWYLYYEVNG